MTQPATPSHHKLLAILLLVISGGFLGMTLGGLYVKWFVPKTGMGWDQLADLLGGLMVGGLLGITAGIGLFLFLPQRRRLVAGAAMAVGSILIVIGLVLTRPPATDASEPVIRETAFSPWYRVKFRTNHNDAVLRAASIDQRPLPFIEAELSTAGPSATYVGWDFETVEGTPSREDLEALLPLVQAAGLEATEEICRTPNEADLTVTLLITLDGVSYRGTVQADCLADRPAMVALAESLEILFSFPNPP